jgi:hypothetical protein
MVLDFAPHLNINLDMINVDSSYVGAANSAEVAGEKVRDILLDLLMLTVDLYREVGKFAVAAAAADDEAASNAKTDGDAASKARAAAETAAADAAPLAAPVDVTSPFQGTFTIACNSLAGKKWCLKVSDSARKSIVEIKYNVRSFFVSLKTEEEADYFERIDDEMLVAAITIVRCIVRRSKRFAYDERITFDNCLKDAAFLTKLNEEVGIIGIEMNGDKYKPPSK